MNRTEAIADFEQDLDEISARTIVKKERLNQCPECGESIHNRMALVEINRNCVTYECHGCGTVDDIWSEMEDGESSTSQKHDTTGETT